MIRDISIQNFRCFENTSISGFKTVNLITGKNNAGKSALLEALLIANSPRPSTIINLRFYRRESPEFSQALPEKTWDNWFFMQDKSKTASIRVHEDMDQFRSIDLSIHENSNKIFMEAYLSNNIDDKYTGFSPSSDSKPSLLQLNININNQDFFESGLMSTSHGLLEKDTKPINSQKISFISAFFPSSNTQLAVQYDQARLNNREKQVLKSLQIIDPLINSIETFNIGVPILYLQKGDEPRLPLSLFGDAITRITMMILSIVGNNSQVLLVDEIENGIHYTNQANLWRMLFRLAKELNVQVFTTTHSLEMLKAFTEVGLDEEFSGLAAHFEMARSVKTGQIIGIKRDMETLEYSLSHGRRVRGE